MAANNTSFTYKDSDGRDVRLGKILNKGGAAGIIYNVSRKPKLVAKIFKTPTDQLHLFIKEMVGDYKNGRINIELTWVDNNKTNLGTWPVELLYDEHEVFKGYLMPKAQGIELQKVIYSSNNYPKYKHFTKVKNKLILAHRLAVVFSNFYKSGNYTNGDVKPQNIFVDELGFPMILDLDNLTIHKGSRKLVNLEKNPGTPNYQAHDYKDDIYTDYFSIAVIFYELIFGIHPYTGSAKDNNIVETQTMINHRMFVHGRKKSFFFMIPHPHVSFETAINKKIQTLFHRAFDLDNPTKRPNMEEWSIAFFEFIQSQKTFKKTYQPNLKNIKPKRKKTYSGNSSSGIFSATGTGGYKSKPSPVFNQKKFDEIRLEFVCVRFFLILFVGYYCIYMQTQWVYLFVSFIVFLIYYNSLNKRSIKHFGMSWSDVSKKNKFIKSNKSQNHLLLTTILFLSLAATVGMVVLYYPKYSDVSWLFYFGFIASITVIISYFIFRAIKKRSLVTIYLIICVGTCWFEYEQIKPPSNLKQLYACKCLYDGPGFAETSDARRQFFDDLTIEDQWLRRKCSEVFNPSWSDGSIDEIIQGGKIAVEEARFIANYFLGCTAPLKPVTDYNNSNIEEMPAATEEREEVAFHDNSNVKPFPDAVEETDSDLLSFEEFKRNNIILEKDLVLKGGYWIHSSRGWNYSDSVIVIGESANLKRNYFIPKGSEYYTEEGISFPSTDGFGYHEARRDIYLNIDTDGYRQIEDALDENWTLSRLGLGDEIITKGNIIKFRDEETEYGVFFIQNTPKAFRDYKYSGVKEESFVLQKNLQIIFQGP